jgi:hypothetical protein
VACDFCGLENKRKIPERKIKAVSIKRKKYSGCFTNSIIMRIIIVCKKTLWRIYFSALPGAF